MNKVRISGKQYKQLIEHLYPGDNKEAVAVALCGKINYGKDYILTVREILNIPYDACYERKPDLVRWPTDFINPLLEKAAKHQYAILKIHCHPGGGEFFSSYDNESDANLFSSIHSWLDSEYAHASCIMLPDRRIFGRVFNSNIQPEKIHQISIAGSDIISWYYGEENEIQEELQERNLQAFGKKTIAQLSRMKIGIVGCSGTGSPTVEQLKRLGVGELVLVDPDFIDKVNLNRIIGSSLSDAEEKMPKVDAMKREIEKVGFKTTVKTFKSHISNVDVVKELSLCDVLFSCVDGAEGRHVLNTISSFYLIPLIDMGVKLEADGLGGISSINGSVHYIQPDGSSLLSRNQYNLESLRTESIKRTNKEELARNQYLANVNESSPAVISINMQVSATAVNELLARIHSYRNIRNEDIDIIKIMFTDCMTCGEVDNEPCPYFSKLTGMADIEPLLNNPELSQI